MFEEKMTGLKKNLVEYAALVESMMDKSVRGLLSKDRALLRTVIDQDEPRANAIEIELDEFCTVVIAQYGPKAKDLRTILMALKMNNDFERAGDHAVNIAESGLFLADHPQLKPFIDIPRMAELAAKMLNDSVQAFINEDAVLAKDVCARDNSVDELRDRILRELITFMTGDPSQIERAIHILRISDNLERIGDLSTNIGEDVIFMVQGRIIKHHHDTGSLSSG